MKIIKTVKLNRAIGALFFIQFLATTVVNGQGADKLIFPNPKNKISLVKAVGYNKLPVGEIISNDSIIHNKLTSKIMAELNAPYLKTLIKLNQCTRNFVADTAGPNILFLSTDEGGFRRHGVIIKKKDKQIKYPALNYVDLVVNEQNISQAALFLYSHELGHVMMANLMGGLPERMSVLQHVSMGITDYNESFSEGWGEHFQMLTARHVQQYNDYLNGKNNYSSVDLLWHSNLDDQLRMSGTSQNQYIFQKLIPDNINIDSLSAEELILLHHTSPLFNLYKLNNAQQMLSCEGMLSALFYRINTDETLQKNYLAKSFYNKFLISPIPPGKKAQDIFTPYENIMLKNFFVFNKIKVSRDSADSAPIFIEFIKEWCNSFPDDRQKIIELFIRATIGKTVSDTAGRLYEKAAFCGITGDYQNYKQLEKQYNQAIAAIVNDVINGRRRLDENIGKEIWVENKNLQVRTTLWSDKNKRNLKVNLNTASVYELASFGKMGLARAKELVKARESIGDFKSLDDAVKHGFVQ